MYVRIYPGTPPGTSPDWNNILMLDHFGTPDTNERHESQQLLAIPCHLCQNEKFLEMTSEGIPELRNDPYCDHVNDLLKDALADEFPTMVGQLATFCVKYVIVDSVAFATTATIAIMRLTAPISPGYDQEPRSQFSSWKKSVPALVTEAYDHE